MVIIGVERRVSGEGMDSNMRGVVQKWRDLWRTCGICKKLRFWADLMRGGVEIFCSTWNIVMDGRKGVTRIKGITRIKTDKRRCSEGAFLIQTFVGLNPFYQP